MKINCSCLLDRALYASNISNDYEDFFVFTKGRVMSIVIWCNVYCILYILPFFFFNGMWFPNCMHTTVFANAWFTPLGGCVVIRNHMC